MDFILFDKVSTYHSGLLTEIRSAVDSLAGDT